MQPLHHALALALSCMCENTFGSKSSLHAVFADSVERRLLRSGVIVTPRRSEDDSEDESFTPADHVRRSVYGAKHDSDDEDSDFD